MSVLKELETLKTVLQVAEQRYKQADKKQSLRAFHGRGHCYEGLSFLNVDIHPPVLLATLYEEQSDHWYDELSEQLKQCAEQCGLDVVIVQKRYIRGAPFDLLAGEVPKKTYANVDELQFSLNLDDNQNIGFFLDMTPGHRWLQQRAEGKNILNLFAYTCAFSVYGIAGGARRVVNIDKSKQALNRGWLNHSLNQLPADRAHFLPHDIFKSVKKLERLGPYELIVIDPPFNQKGSFLTHKDYARLLRHLPRWMADQCEILACLNAPGLDESFLRDLFAEELPQCEFVERLPTREDFPERDVQRNLKLLVYQCS